MEGYRPIGRFPNTHETARADAAKSPRPGPTPPLARLHRMTPIPTTSSASADRPSQPNTGDNSM